MFDHEEKDVFEKTLKNESKIVTTYDEMQMNAARGGENSMMTTRKVDDVGLLLGRADGTRRINCDLKPSTSGATSNKGTDKTRTNINNKGAAEVNRPPPLRLKEIPKIVFNPPPAPASRFIPLGRKCSDVATPNFCMSPNVSPISPIVFFPPNFSPHTNHERSFENFNTGSPAHLHISTRV